MYCLRGFYTMLFMFNLTTTLQEILIHKQRCDDLEESIRNLKSGIRYPCNLLYRLHSHWCLSSIYSHLRHTLKDHACKRQPLMALGKYVHKLTTHACLHGVYTASIFLDWPIAFFHRCLPSTEVRLNIPLQEHLPVWDFIAKIQLQDQWKSMWYSAPIYISLCLWFIAHDTTTHNFLQ